MPGAEEVGSLAGPAPEQDEAARELTRNLGRRLKAMRSERGWSLSDLATLSGVSRSMLSEIERERANPTLSVTARLARAFGFTIQELIGLAEGSPAIQTIRVDDPAQFFPSGPGCRIRTLSPLNLEKMAEFYELTLEPGRELRSQPHFAGTREFLTVREGTVRVESGADSDALKPGDSATYRADLPHAIVNTGSGTAVLLLVVLYR